MDLASFELVSNCWLLLKQLLEARLLDIVVCNEEEANMVAQVHASLAIPCVLDCIVLPSDPRMANELSRQSPVPAPRHDTPLGVPS